MARPKGSNQAKPTRSDVIEFYKLLREKARAGDVNAAGWLVVADTQAKAKP
jgi:hypothetical protein